MADSQRKSRLRLQVHVSGTDAGVFANPPIVRFSGAALALLVALTSCGKKADIKGKVAELEKSFPTAAAVATTSSSPHAPVPAPAASEANAYVSAALSAARANDYASGVIALQEAQRMNGVTANQLITIEQAKQAMVADLLARAERGDPKAKVALAAIEKSHSQ